MYEKMSPIELVDWIFTIHLTSFKDKKRALKMAELATHMTINKMMESDPSDYHKQIKEASLNYKFPVL